MKKILLSNLFVFVILVFCSCGIPAQKQECFVIPESFICSVTVKNDSDRFKGTLQRVDGKYTMTVDSPESLSGLVTEYCDGKYKAVFSESELEILPKKDFFLNDIIDYIENSYNEGNVECIEEDGAHLIRKNGWELKFG